MSVERRRAMIDPEHPHLSLVRQCALVSIGRSTYYRTPTPDTAENLALMRLVDEQFLETPWYGSRQMTRHLRRLGRLGYAPHYPASHSTQLTAIRQQIALAIGLDG